MAIFDGQEKRKYIRLEAKYIVSYSVQEISPYYDISQTKNISQGGAVFTTNRAFDKGMILTMVMRFPFYSEKITVRAEVIEAVKIMDSLYNTRIKFIDLDEDIFKKLGEFISIKRRGHERR